MLNVAEQIFKCILYVCGGNLLFICQSFQSFGSQMTLYLVTFVMKTLSVDR